MQSLNFMVCRLCLKKKKKDTQRHPKNRNFIHCGYIQSLWGTVWPRVTKSEHVCLRWVQPLLLGAYPAEMCPYARYKTCSRIFIITHTPMSIERGKQSRYSHTRKSSNKKQQTTTAWDSTDVPKPEEHKEQDTKKVTLHGCFHETDPQARLAHGHGCPWAQSVTRNKRRRCSWEAGGVSFWIWVFVTQVHSVCENSSSRPRSVCVFFCVLTLTLCLNKM